MKTKNRFLLLSAFLSTCAVQTMIGISQESRVEFPEGDTPVFGWQKDLMAEPKGGEKFAVSAFIHPLRTPGGFVCTDLQPDDHMHHLGIWWPWKYVEVDGRIFNTWEIQQGGGAHVAREVKRIESSAEGVQEWEFTNETIIKPRGEKPRVVIRETAHVALRAGKDATVVDITLRQQAVDAEVTIAPHRYSGFAWRGPHDWNKDNSTLITSGGKVRDDANGTPARWFAVSGPAPGGSASVLILSAAEKQAGRAENLRVWDSTNHNGAPFVNFNPVIEKPLALVEANPAVAHRRYRVIASDKAMIAADAEAAWKEWMAK